ncbi:hypothetical protein [uncultured Roseobacter sp.]|uniref:hypothetical protein n=1 Tax=uncultured Roseobacter sp. TaxID=114847 RepID=UPI001D0A1007|nr:hypothetical protein [uncultured Roseobacter sp.]
MIRVGPVSLTALALVCLPLTLSAQTSQGGFETMAQPTEDQTECKAPRPPKELDSFAYVRNGYREILRIDAYQTAIQSDVCGCPFNEIDWSLVVRISKQYVTSDNPKLPFDVIDLRSQADGLEAEFLDICGN